jgi:hypothetical protein
MLTELFGDRIICKRLWPHRSPDVTSFVPYKLKEQMRCVKGNTQIPRIMLKLQRVSALES